MSTATTLIVLTPSADFTSISVSDTTDYSADSSFVTATVNVYKPKESTYTTINLISNYTNVATNPITYSITPSDIGLDDTIFPDGEYVFVFAITTEEDTYTESDNELMYGNIYAGIQEEIGNLCTTFLTTSCCGNKGKDEIDMRFNMFMMLQSAIFSHICTKYTEAQSKIDSLTDYLAALDCETC